MATGLSSETLERGSKKRAGGARNGSESPNEENIEPFAPRSRRDHDPKDLRSWAKRTGFVSMFSGETTAASSSGNFRKERDSASGFDLERGVEERERGASLSPKIEIDPVLGRTRVERGPEIEQLNNGNLQKNGRNGNRDEERRVGFNENATVLGSIDEERRVGSNGSANGSGHGVSEANAGAETIKKEELYRENEVGFDGSPDQEPILGRRPRAIEVKCGILDNPGFALVTYYSIQHYVSLVGSLVFIPLILVPAMGGTDKDTAHVISTMLLVSGITTILHSFFGTRLPLVQGSSFVYLAPALVVANSREFRNLTEHKFRYIMRELQGAIIVGSLFQSILGFSGLMSLLLRLINPVVVAPTIAVVGLAFFSYGFPQAGSCVEISVPLIVLVLIFTLYIRGISFRGHRIFQIYAVPLSIVITWAYAFFLTAGGAYNFRGCSPNVPSSNILVDACIRHAYTMKHCRTDVSDAWTASSWVRIPYPLQWGLPIFHFRTSIIMVIVSLVSSVDAVGTYYSASLQINSKPPTPGIVSRGIGMEGFCSLLAGLWGTGTGSTTLTENLHTINTTEVANRRAVQLGALLLIIVSFIEKWVVFLLPYH